jgi:hypothetical protein
LTAPEFAGRSFLPPDHPHELGVHLSNQPLAERKLLQTNKDALQGAHIIEDLALVFGLHSKLSLGR